MTTVTGPPGQDRVGEYRLIARIGEGGMGVVHLAQAPDGRRVALKVLRPHVIGDEEARERLAREVGSLRRVSSPRVSEILDADPHGPTPFVATRYVPGLSLHEHVREEGAVAGADLLHLAAGLAEALAAVHAVGVLHRDIKPSNVLMEGRSPVLIDFGLARVAEDSRLTHTGWLLGTPGYLAPEILYGDEASPASDVHAWAATVVYAATGRPPYGKGPVMAVMDRVRRGEHDLSAVPEPLVGLLRACLAPEPLDRPSLIEVRAWLREQQQPKADPAPAPVAPPPDQWTMPVAASAREPRTEVRPPEPPPPTPYAAPSVDPRSTQAIPVGAPTPLPASVRRQRSGQLVALGLLMSVAVAAAPYAGTMLVAVLVLLLRTASVTRERHDRRRLVRGRARWYDVPTTTLSTPGYAVLALAGTLLLVGWAVAAAVAFGVVEAVFGPPLPVGLLLMGVVFTVALWWGPGSHRLKRTTDRLVVGWASAEWAGLFVIGLCVVGSVVLLAMLLGAGPHWAPATQSPWSHGLLADVARYL